MTDEALVRKKLLRIELCLADLQSAHLDRLAVDRREERFVEHTLQLAIQATIDVAAHIVADEQLGDPRSAHELFTLLAAGGWIAAADLPTLRAMVGFRNVLVHEYDTVDLGIVRDVAEHRVADLQRFVDAVRRELDERRRPET